MSERIETAKRLLDKGQCDEALKLLCDTGVPDSGIVCALLARAYLQRGDARGDLFSARFFADRAREHGFDQPWLEEINDALGPEEHPREACHACKPDFSLGGWDSERPEKPSPYSFSALSRTKGVADTPKDFDWVAQNIPCQAACPAGTDIPEYLTAIFDNEYERAYEINLRDNVFPGVLGRVCARPCEAECRHGWDDLGEPVAICHSKRSAADLCKQELKVLPKWFEPSGKTVAVVGAGVAGLAAARQLALCGHTVTVYEKHTQAGGMMNQGIPEFRLPRNIIDHEIAQIEALGIEIRCGVAIGTDVTFDRLLEDNDAVVMAAGTLRPNLLDLPGKDLSGIRHGLDFLLKVNEGGKPDLGERVVVIGGGFTAMDCARTARRLGATTVELPHGTNAADGSILRIPAEMVTVWYRRSETEMLVTPGELEELEHEGIPLELMVTPKAYLGKDGKVTSMRFIRTRLGEPDEDGRRRPIPIEGSEFEIPVDTVLLATGQFPDTDWIQGEHRAEIVGDDQWLLGDGSGLTALANVFAVGDFAQGANSLIDAIGHAKTTVRNIDAYLMGESRFEDHVLISDVRESGRIREMDDVPLQPLPALPLTQRDLQSEVEQGYDADLAVEETQRCYRCHLKFEIDPDKCIYCDWCLKVKPRPECILKLKSVQQDEDGRITGWEEAETTQETTLVWINQYECIRCGACVAACPVDAISIQKAALESVP